MAKLVSVISFHQRGNSFSEQLKNLIPTIKNHTALDGGKALEDKGKISVKKHISKLIKVSVGAGFCFCFLKKIKANILRNLMTFG